MPNETIISKKWRIFIASLVITAILSTSVLVLGSSHYTEVKDFYLYESSEPVYSSFHVINTGPNYFFPIVQVQSRLSNLNFNEIEGFHYFVSTDNSSWVEVPLSNEDKYTVIGTIPSNGMDTILFDKWIFPIQNNTNAPIMPDTFRYGISFVPVMTPQTSTIMILLVIAIFSFILKILEYIFK